jgi:GNAT superfamily N-acetyltransferase
MTDSALDLRPIAHAALSLTEAPYLKHYRRGRFRTWNGVAFTGSDLPGPGFNFASVLGPAPPFDDILPIAQEFFADATQGWGVLVEGDAGHPVEAELKARGWVVAEDEPAFVIPQLSTAALLAQGPQELAIRRVCTDADEAIFHALLAGAFGAPPEFATAMLPVVPFISNPEIALFIGSADGRDVSATGYSRVGPTAIVTGLGTLESDRGRGYGAAITRATLAAAAANGCTSAALRSGPKSVPLYERLGFRYVCQHRTYAAPPPA